MRLASFILENIEPIVQEWESFARTLETSGDPMPTEELRDHAELMLRTIAVDLRRQQTPHQQSEKSKGHGVATDDSAAMTHAITRLMSGFSIDQLVAEFRALRASVISHWMQQVKAGSALEMEDMIRFNEAIDQALAESISSYNSAVQASRNIFLGILGHDLRTPLSAILLCADVLLRSDDLDPRTTKIASRIYASVKRASQIVGDLLDFTRSQVGPGLPINKAEVNIIPACERIIEELGTLHPGTEILLQSDRKAIGYFDGPRLEQAFSNLVGNAVQHGERRTPVSVTVDVSEGMLRFSVHNFGLPIPDAVLPLIFNPMGRYSEQASFENGPYASLGLGLFICSEIAKAHGGRIEVASEMGVGTTFTMLIPVTEGPRPSLSRRAGDL